MKRLFLFYVILFSSILLNISCEKGSAPVAAFTATPTSGIAPHSVSFTDQSTNSPTSWNWNYGDGVTSTSRNPSYTYSSAGTYTVILTATNSNGSDTETKTNYITVTEIDGIIFNPSLTYGAVTDIDGNTYKTIQIGTQTWMAENLKTTKYNDNTAIPLVTNNYSWSGLNNPAYCWYGNYKGAYKSTYGALYNWYAVSTTTNGSKNICPTGWHVPTDVEWTTLTDFLGGESVACGKLKEIGTTHWSKPNTDATNESGFTALPGGYRNHYNGDFINVGYYGCWWSATELDTIFVGYRFLSYYDSDLGRYGDNKQNGFSVRCVRD
ncbi:MAG: PKD domain-containing protein [Alphaproteobacteria bacterium]|nr:MAG: PKD domain-containing protein [Alphaproteobacteria bacterium]